MKKILLTISLLLTTNLWAQNQDLLFSPNGIAEMHITLEDGKQIHDIKNEKANEDYEGKLRGTMTIVNSVNSTYGQESLYTGNILIKGRGNTSWHRPKRPYNIDLVENDWETKKFASLLDMPEGKEWSLLAFWNDRSLMRFQVVSYLGQLMTGLSWMPKNRYIEVWINDDYRGLYVLSEKILRDENRINVKSLKAESTNLTGGYILEASTPDKLKPIERDVQFKTEKEGINFTFKYPKPANITKEQRSWIIGYLNDFENLLRSSSFNDPQTGYANYIDVNSFIDWTIIHELSKGCDNLFHASVFVHKNRNGKLNMSAPWDFDLSFGNSGIFTEEGSWVRTHRWFNNLYRDPAYAQQFNDRYIELFPLLNSIPEMLNENYNQLETSGVLDREYGRFPEIIDEFVSDGEGRRTPTSYKGHIQFLSEWIMSRHNWIYIDIATDNTTKGQRMKTIKPVIRVMAPERMTARQSFEIKVMRSHDNNDNKYLYSWNDGAFSTHRSRTITQHNKYWVKIKDEWGNISLASDTLYFGVDIPSSIAKISADEIKIHFDRQNNHLRIQLPSEFINQNIDISLWDLQGVKVKEYNSYLSTSRIELPVPEQIQGMYILKLQIGNQLIAKKIIL